MGARVAGKGKPKGHWITVAYGNGGYHHIFVPNAEGTGAKAAIGKHVPKPGAVPGAHKTGNQVVDTGGKGKGHHVTVMHADGGFRHVHVKGADAAGAKVAIGKHVPKPATLTHAAGGKPLKAPPHPAEAAAHAQHKAAPYEPGLPLSKQRDHFADSEERRVAAMTGGKWHSGNEPSDVGIAKAGAGGGTHHIEVKSKSFGGKQELSVHPGALETKIDSAHANPKDTWHSVLLDTRHSSEGGAHKGSYSGNEGYYKRAVGRYPISQMHPFKNADELKTLIATPNSKLPEKARGAFPSMAEMPAFREKAANERAYNNARSTERKQRLAAEGKSAYGREPTPAAQ